MTATMTGVKLPMMAALVAALLAGCSSVPPDTFEIASPTNVAVRSGSRAQLLIPEPTAIKTLDSDKIVVKTSPYAIEYLGQSQWSDRLPRMVQLRLLQAFENTGRIGAVGVPGQGLAIDYQLIMEIRRFEIDTAGAATARIDISVKALNDRNGTVRQTKIFSASSPVSGAGNSAYVAALNRAFDQISGEIVTWTLGLI
ncbi:ABC-type transport auxiliary lipoprotein family protein [Jiella avicenniae]|uniref:ABC-type transport auxiliary lipoprotein family protein n=1 Tax=Jiella avicenniae TaxID=2907202 RepID=A0A9X1NZ39_9HYPH|nr:ABC-type transport auxiliary lipoprotein family protein [Jiella avicenniae]MCE7028297.1 ABC-type transport auxiliary lipoprotein family protein [Jiella avicenniae]